MPINFKYTQFRKMVYKEHQQQTLKTSKLKLDFIINNISTHFIPMVYLKFQIGNLQLHITVLISVIC